MTVAAVEPMSAEEREYRGLLNTAIRLEQTWPIRIQTRFDPQRRWTDLECRLMAASNALQRVA